ncbi:hypothetical protein [Luethyella okanaganae]|uniref:FxLD family lantipeptide n=1 Tax=Luethyella okanaganae TaxID=69372 RepID=A0ABW1VD06_9MICO
MTDPDASPTMTEATEVVAPGAMPALTLIGDTDVGVCEGDSCAI